MRKAVVFAVAFTVAIGASAHIYYQDAENVDMARHTLRNEPHRTEIILPQVNGYNVYKADLHTHTIYSDGGTTPEYRVHEAWMDGLDVMACTEHIEYRRWEGHFLQYLKEHLPEGTKASTNDDIKVDFNLANKLSAEYAEKYGLTIIPGVEITRNHGTIGHYNALFVTDANTIFDHDPEQSIRNARAQGALIMHNHPGWIRKSLDMIDFEKKVYAAGLIDGVEVMNGPEFYPSVVTRALENGLFMSANTDIHYTTAMEYNVIGHHRNMTFIFAKDRSLDSLKEALKARRTLAYSHGSIAGEEPLVRDFFLASMKMDVVRVDGKGRRTVNMKNPTSLAYLVHIPGQNPMWIDAFSSRNVTVDKDADLVFTVENMWIPGEKNHPEFKLKVD